MTSRRMPSGQGPARRSGASGRGATARDTDTRAGGRATAGRSASGRQAVGRGDAGRAAGRPRARSAGDAARSGNRPAAARRAAAGGATKRTSALPPRRLSGRAIVLMTLLLLLALGYTYPVRVYLTQEADIASLQADKRAQLARIQELREQVAKWQDNEYVRSQARRRLYYGRPGEALLVVLDGDTAAGADGVRPASRPTRPDPWYGTLWSSVEAADGEPGR